MSIQPMVRSRLKTLIAERNLDRLREQQPRLTIRSISEASHVPISVIVKLNSNQAKRVDLETLNKLCTYFNCSLTDILEYTPDKN
jgi:putative transcriptional regulator